MDTFDLKKFLVENKTTAVSRLTENTETMGNRIYTIADISELWHNLVKAAFVGSGTEPGIIEGDMSGHKVTLDSKEDLKNYMINIGCNEFVMRVEGNRRIIVYPENCKVDKKTTETKNLAETGYDSWLNRGNPANDREPDMKECPVCGGEGYLSFNGKSEKCERCDGTGEVVDDGREEEREDYVSRQRRKNRLTEITGTESKTSSSFPMRADGGDELDEEENKTSSSFPMRADGENL